MDTERGNRVTERRVFVCQLRHGLGMRELANEADDERRRGIGESTKEQRRWIMNGSEPCAA